MRRRPAPAGCGGRSVRKSASRGEGIDAARDQGRVGLRGGIRSFRGPPRRAQPRASGASLHGCAHRALEYLTTRTGLHGVGLGGRMRVARRRLEEPGCAGSDPCSSRSACVKPPGGARMEQPALLPGTRGGKPPAALPGSPCRASCDAKSFAAACRPRPPARPCAPLGGREVLASACLSSAPTFRMLPAQNRISGSDYPASPCIVGPRFIGTRVRIGRAASFPSPPEPLSTTVRVAHRTGGPAHSCGPHPLRALAPASRGAIGATQDWLEHRGGPDRCQPAIWTLRLSNPSTPRTKDLRRPHPPVTRRRICTGLSRMSRISSRRSMSKSGGR